MFIDKQTQQKIDLLINNNSLPITVSNPSLFTLNYASLQTSVTTKEELEDFIKANFKPQVKITFKTTDYNTPLQNAVKVFLDERLAEVTNGKFNSLSYTLTTNYTDQNIEISLWVYNRGLLNLNNLILVNYHNKTTELEVSFENSISNSFSKTVKTCTSLLAFYRPQHLVYKENPAFRVQLFPNQLTFKPFKKLTSHTLIQKPYEFFERVFHYVPKGQFNTEIDNWVSQCSLYYDRELKVRTNATPQVLKDYHKKVQEIYSSRNWNYNNNTL